MSILNPTEGFNVVASFTDHQTCLTVIQNLSPKLALVDATFMREPQLGLLKRLNWESVHTPFVLFAPLTDKTDRATVALTGSLGLLPKQIAAWKLLYCMRQAVAGKPFLPGVADRANDIDGDEVRLGCFVSPLTQREDQISQLVARGLSNKEIGRELTVTAGTVKIHLHRIYKKLAIRNRTALAVRSAKSGEGAGVVSEAHSPSDEL